MNYKDLIKNLLRHDYEGAKEFNFFESEPESMEVQPFESFTGSREDYLCLKRFSQDEGLKFIKLPVQRQLVSLRKEFALVPFYLSKWARDENLHGTYVLIRKLSPGPWEAHELFGSSTYDEYITAWIFDL